MVHHLQDLARVQQWEDEWKEETKECQDLVYKCSPCKEDFKSKSELIRHMYTKHQQSKICKMDSVKCV